LCLRNGSHLVCDAGHPSRARRWDQCRTRRVTLINNPNCLCFHAWRLPSRAVCAGVMRGQPLLRLGCGAAASGDGSSRMRSGCSGQNGVARMQLSRNSRRPEPRGWTQGSHTQGAGEDAGRAQPRSSKEEGVDDGQAFVADGQPSEAN
jgi:hypothetical protein